MLFNLVCISARVRPSCLSLSPTIFISRNCRIFSKSEFLSVCYIAINSDGASPASTFGAIPIKNIANIKYHPAVFSSPIRTCSPMTVYLPERVINTEEPFLYISSKALLYFAILDANLHIALDSEYPFSVYLLNHITLHKYTSCGAVNLLSSYFLSCFSSSPLSGFP